MRPDFYRVPHNRPLASGKIRHCFGPGFKPNTVFGNSGTSRRRIGFYPGGSENVPGHQVRRPWNGNSADNFYWADADTFDRVSHAMMVKFEDYYEKTLSWNELNPEAEIVTVLKDLGINVAIC